MNKYDYKMIWWNWFCCSPKYWGHGLTLSKLNKVSEHIFNDTFIWYDLFERHCLFGLMPWDVKKQYIENYNHAIGNFAGMIYETCIKLKIVKL